MTTIHVRNDLGELMRVARLVDSFCARHDLGTELAFEVNLALDEALTNVIQYGYSDGGDHEIVVGVTLEKGECVVEIEDDGRPFDPRAAPPIDITRGLAERPVGGLGIHLMRHLMDRLDYERRDGKNRLRMTKKAHPREAG